MTPKVIIRASKVIIEVGAYDELPTEVVNLPDESEYRCCLADMVPDGELGHGGVCDTIVVLSEQCISVGIDAWLHWPLGL